MKYLLPDGNIIIAAPEHVAEKYPDAVLVEEPDIEIEAWPNTRRTILTILAFRDRFTAAEKIAIEFAMLDDPTASIEKREQAAMLRAFDKDLGVAKEVNLSHQQLIDGVRALEAFGVIAEGRADEVLGLTPELGGDVEAE